MKIYKHIPSPPKEILFKIYISIHSSALNPFGDRFTGYPSKTSCQHCETDNTRHQVMMLTPSLKCRSSTTTFNLTCRFIGLLPPMGTLGSSTHVVVALQTSSNGTKTRFTGNNGAQSGVPSVVVQSGGDSHKAFHGPRWCRGAIVKSYDKRLLFDLVRWAENYRSINVTS